MNNRCVDFCDDIAHILERIIRMQKEAVREELREEFCDISFIGGTECCVKHNTRPIQVFTDDDKAWSCPIERNEDGCNTEKDEKTCVFRVEKIQRDSVVLRALIEKNNEREEREERREEEEFEEGRRRRRERFKSTNSFKTIRLRDIAALRCLPDTFVNICIR